MNYGRRTKGQVRKGRELRGEDIIFTTAREDEEEEKFGGCEDEERDEERWELRAIHIRRTELVRRATSPRSLTEPRAIETFDVLANALTRNKGQLFPMWRRPKLRGLVDAEPEDMAKWFQDSGIVIDNSLTGEQQSRAIHLFYTWRDVFETDLLRIRRTDLIEHTIILDKEAKPYMAKVPLYTEQEIKFCQELIPRMEEAGLIRRCDSAWGARTKFVPKPRADLRPKNDKLRMVHNFMPLNSVTEKSRYPCPCIEQIVHTICKKGKSWFFTADAANSYRAIPIRSGDEHKLGFVTPYGMYCYTFMGQGLTGGIHTYIQPVPGSSLR